MATADLVPSVLAYWRDLVGAGWAGLFSARQEFRAVSWLPVVFGAGLGVLGTRVSGRRRSASDLAAGGLVGSFVGGGAAVAWASRGMIRPAARVAAQRVNAVRDAHWLETHPIDYA